MVSPSFSELLDAAARGGRQLEEEGVLSLALPLGDSAGVQRGDPLALLPRLGADQRFRFLWDGAPGLCLAACGTTHSLELSGPKRFELAQRFSAVSLSRLVSVPQFCPPLARPRILLAFSFFDSPLQERGLQDGAGVAGVQAVLPRWQLSRQGRHCWLRLQRTLGGATTARAVAEELWEQARALEQPLDPADLPSALERGPGIASRSRWEPGYRQAVQQALELIEAGSLRKLVLAVRQRLQLDRPLDPLELLRHLRLHQPGSCRFLWQQRPGEALIGASPERLLAVRQGQLRSDALAGTAPLGEPAEGLTASGKDRHEHELVVETITQVLAEAGLAPRRPRHPRLARHGQLVHLHTPITAMLGEQQPLALAAALHPTPAVAGLPRREAMAWLRSLEVFERGHYAAPIGWIDSAGDAELRVAIRSGRLCGDQLDLTAGAGLVRGSHPERELQEVALKLGVLQQQLNLPLSPSVNAPW
ncbi:isochorismate synthase [Synechococcus sp. CS-1324]|uniref:isochorismate synthase n=1 Tax=unclassified Synechococcus TaxID=2626047 RepID=UPI000DB0291F|nr:MULTISPECIES: isochorismate synthase [unclassified Synechococcus]MCT0214173.1 isochorismate synthase [Synechococcus sp. CS-1326]MCT0231358.1 isochorismate synthase [Synechococcus sp. CS-1324]MCT0232503.1 isochorismate synthase [Synechococcus sp. CS-1327]PZV02676.1 MAG: isochorismate synthase [Cyanobium sp.]